MSNKLEPITVGQLEDYLKLITNKDTVVQVGFGEHHQDCNFLLNINGKLALYHDVYMQEQNLNIDEVLSLNIDNVIMRKVPRHYKTIFKDAKNKYNIRVDIKRFPEYRQEEGFYGYIHYKVPGDTNMSLWTREASTIEEVCKKCVDSISKIVDKYYVDSKR